MKKILFVFTLVTMVGLGLAHAEDQEERNDRLRQNCKTRCSNAWDRCSNTVLAKQAGDLAGVVATRGRAPSQYTTGSADLATCNDNRDACNDSCESQFPGN